MERYLVELGSVPLQILKAIGLKWHFLLVALYTLSKVTTLAADFGDALCLLMCFGLVTRSRSLNQYLKYHSGLGAECDQKTTKMWPTKDDKQRQICWSMIYNDLIKLRSIADQTSKFLSPIFFASIMVNGAAIIFNV